MENLRIRLTKQMIQQALVELLKTKNIEKITVTDLCKTATVNRTTFYKYYGSPVDVLEEIIDQLFTKILEIGQNYPSSQLFQKEILNFLAENKQLCIVLIDRVPFDTFARRLINLPALVPKTMAEFSDEYSDRQKEYLLSYYQYGCFGLISRWLHDELPLSIEELQDLGQKLANNIMFKIREKDS